MALDSEVSSLIADIYGGAYDATIWDRTMNAIGDRLDAQFLMTATVRRNTQVAPETRFHHVRHERFDDALTEYAAETYRQDPTIKHVMQNPRGGVFESIKYIGTEAYEDHAYIRWNKSMAGSMFWTAHHDDVGADLSLGVALHRSEVSGPLNDEDSKELAMLFGHMRNALTLAARPPIAEADDPCLVLDGGGRVLLANASAQVLLNSTKAITICDGHLRAQHQTSATMLTQAIMEVLSPVGSHKAVPLQQEFGLPLFCEVRALRGSTHPFASMSAAAFVRIINADATPKSRCEMWRLYFGLKPAEARLAGVLLESDNGLREAAVHLGVAYGTARVQLASVFEKTNVRNQSQLLRLLTRLN